MIRALTEPFDLAAVRARQQQRKSLPVDPGHFDPFRLLIETDVDLIAACTEVERLRDWQATVTVALRHEGGVFFEDVADHIRHLRAE